MLAAAALVPLAWLIGEATEHAAHHTGPGIGGFLNATFGNAPELIIALFAVNADDLSEVVRGSLTGIVVGNLLLVLGFSLLAGGRGTLDRQSCFISLGLVALAVLLLLIPAIPGLDGDPDRTFDRRLSVIPAVDPAGRLRRGHVHLAPAAPRHARLRRAERDAGWSLRTSLLVLGLATVVTALIAEILVGSLDEFADERRAVATSSSPP